MKLKDNNVGYMCKLQLCYRNNSCSYVLIILRFIGSPESCSTVKGATSWPLAINYLNFIPFELLLFTQECRLWVLSEVVNCLPDLRKISLYFSLIQHTLSIIIRLAPLYCRSSLDSEAGIKLYHEERLTTNLQKECYQCIAHWVLASQTYYRIPVCFQGSLAAQNPPYTSILEGCSVKDSQLTPPDACNINHWFIFVCITELTL